MARPTPEQVYAAALDDLHDGNLRRAEERLVSILDAAPRAAQSVYLLGMVKVAQRDFGAARSMIGRAFALKPWVRELDHIEPDLDSAIAEAAAALPDWRWPDYDRARRAWFAPGLTFDSVCRFGILSSGSSFVQIGANDGVSDDPLRDHIVQGGWHGLLVEPLPAVFERLVANYAGVPGLRFANVAVTENEGTVRLFVETDGRSVLASLVPERNALSRTRGPVQAIEVPARRLMGLIGEHEIERLDLLQIDTEGYDYHVLRQLDFGQRRPKVVHMEFYCLPIDERLATFELLREHGFAYRFLERDLLAVDADLAATHFGVTPRALPEVR